MDSPPEAEPGARMQPDVAAGEAREWERLVDAGAIPDRNPPPAPETAAIRHANDALFRRLRPPPFRFGGGGGNGGGGA